MRMLIEPATADESVRNIILILSANPTTFAAVVYKDGAK